MLRHFFSTLLILATILVPATSHAGYFSLTEQTKDAQECIVYDVRFPYWTNGIYIATYPGHIRSREGWRAEYYGGVVSNLRGRPNLIQYAAWQMRGKGAPKSGIDFIYAGRHMSWERTNWEGSVGGIKGVWPNDEFKKNMWYRVVNRAWTPVKHTPHLGYAGVWMKNLATGKWYHLATFKFPAELTGFNRMGGFTEFFTSRASNECAVEFRNVYAMRNGIWGAESTFRAFNHKKDTIRFSQPADRSAVTLTTTRMPIIPGTKDRKTNKVVRQSVTLKQPKLPQFFDAVEVSHPAAERLGNQLVVTWQVDAKSSPQLGYTVEILKGGTPVASRSENDPESRQCVLDVADGGSARQARMQIVDIFGRRSKPVTFSIAKAQPLPPVAETKTCPGLAYRYFESAQPDEWQRIPDFAKLTLKRQGVVATPDPTLRMKRVGYAVEYSGFLRVNKPGLYTFNLIAASAAKLIIDGRTVVDADGYHAISMTPGTVALLPGLHKLALHHCQGKRQRMQADDFLQVTWSGPGFSTQVMPTSAFWHTPRPQEPTVTVKAARQGAGGIDLRLSAKVTSASIKCDRIEYYAFNPGYDYFGGQGARGTDYLLAESRNPAESASAAIWGGSAQTVRARLFYGGNQTIDSAPFVLPKAPSSGGKSHGLVLTQLEHHLYPMAYSDDAKSVTLVGESMGLLTKPFAGDGTLIARLAGITSDKPMPDGTKLPKMGNWLAGITMRKNLQARPGAPLGGKEIPYVAVMVGADRRARYCDSTMINGAGNQPRGTGNRDRWLKIVRKGANFTLSSSPDGKAWKVIKTTNLPKMPNTLNAGFVIYCIPNATNRVHWARFDHISFTHP